MKPIFHLLLLALVSLSVSFNQAAFAQDSDKPTSTLTDQQRQDNLASFDYVWKTVKEQYWDPQLEGVDWEAARKKYRPRVDEALTNEASRKAINQLLNELGVSHFGIIPVTAYKQLDNEKPPGQHTAGFDVRLVEDQILVTELYEGSAAADMGVKTGWRITQIGDEVVSSRLEEISAELADHPHLRTILVDAAKRRLRGDEGDSVLVTFQNENESDIQLEIPMSPPRGKRARFGHIPEFHIRIEIRELEGNIGYIRFNAFMDPAWLMPQINKAMREFQDADGIVIDVRGNGGGLGEMGTSIMGWLLPGDRQQIGTVVLRDNELKMFVHPRAEKYRGPVAVLIDEMSISAAEFFASGVKELELAELFGTRTAGAVLGSSIEKLPNGDGFQFARANYLSSKTGKTLEGIGVSPHEEVFHSREALLGGKDRQLEAAVNWIQNQDQNEEKK